MALTLDLGNLFVHLRLNTIQYDVAMKKAVSTMIATTRKLAILGKRMISSISNTFRRFGAFTRRWGTRIGIALLAIGALSVKVFASFDDAMIKSLAIMGEVSAGMQQKMRDLARTLAIEGVTSATNLAKSYFFLASAGLTAEQSMASLATVEAFAVAGAFDMAEATDLLTDAQSALGLTVKDATQNMMNMTRVSDVLTGANTLANASTRQFALALTSQAGPAMKAFNVPLEQGVAVLAAFADQGIKAQVAGSMFSRMLRLMTKGFRDNTAAWKRLKINVFDVTGELLPMGDIINSLTKALGSMSTQQKGAALEMLGFMARSQQAILPLLGLGDRINEYNRQLKEMNGITKEVHEKQLKSFSSQMKILLNNVKDVAISIGEKLAPELLKFSEWFRNNRETIKNWSVAFADRVIFIKNELFSFLKFLKTNFWVGVKLGLDIGLAFFKGFGESITLIMKSAAVQAADSFARQFGKTLGPALINQSGLADIDELTLGRALLRFPITGGIRLAMLDLGEELFKSSFAPPMITNLGEQLKLIISDTQKEIELLKKLAGLNAPAVTVSDPLLRRLQNTPIGDPTGGVSGSLPSSKVERRISAFEKMLIDRIESMRKKAVGLADKIPFVGGGFVIGLTKEYERELKRIERIEKHGLERIAAQRIKILGERDRGLAPLSSLTPDIAKLLQGGGQGTFELARTSVLDPRSSGVGILDINKQMLRESERQTRILEEIENKTLA